ncbi:MAG: hypothetical protein ACI4VH_01025 [Clostridia bacterium]
MAFFTGQASNQYSTSVKGEGTAPIATWKFKINEQREQVQTINLAATCNNETILDHKIAPGTSGSFDIIIDATDSNVGINYNINFLEETNKPNNLKFIYKDKEYNSIKELDNCLSGTIHANDENKSITLNIQWKWDYETGNSEEEILKNDLIDTEDLQKIQNYTFTIYITGTQLDPNMQ